MGGRREVLRCTRDSLEIQRIDFGVAWHPRRFPIRDIKGFRFGQVGATRFGPINGLRFVTHDKPVMSFRSLRAVEAQTILPELQRLGVNVVVDPAMLATVEAERSRKSLFG